MDNSGELISIIIPMFNVANTIKRCVESVRMSSYKKIEIILIDDGSTDHTLELCKSIQKIDPRIIIVSKKNGSAGLSREEGLKKAKGKYIAFVDADDYIETSMYEKLYNQMISNDLDACFCGNYEFFSSGKIKENNIRFPKQIYNESEIKESILRNTVWFAPENSNENPMFSLWRGLYSHSVIKNNNIHFEDEKIVSSEDGVFNFKFICNAERIGFVHECLYYYGIYATSLTNDSSRWEERDDGRANRWYRTIMEYADKKDVSGFIEPYINGLYLGRVRKAINRIIINNERIKEEYKETKKRFVYLKEISIIKTKGNGLKDKIDLFLCLYCFSLYKLKLKRQFR